MLTFDEQHVRLFVVVHIRIWMCCCLVAMIAIADLCAILCIYTTTLQYDDGSQLWIDIDFGGIYDDTLLC